MLAASQFRSLTLFQRKTDEDGFALLGLMLFSALFFLTVLFFSFYANIVQADLRLKRNCVNISWQHQVSQKKNLEQLLSLNPQAYSLRKSWQQAKLRLVKAVATGQPVVIAAAKAQLLAIYFKKQALAARQNSVLLKAKIEAQNFKVALHSRVQAQSITAAQSGLAVEPEDFTELASPYQPKSSFSMAQQSGGQWQNSIAELLHPTVEKLVLGIEPIKNVLNKKISGQCYVTLERRYLKWFVSLSAAKS